MLSPGGMAAARGMQAQIHQYVREELGLVSEAPLPSQQEAPDAYMKAFMRLASATSGFGFARDDPQAMAFVQMVMAALQR